jgi:hypothetical protein
MNVEIMQWDLVLLEKYSNIKLREKRGCKRKHLYGDEASSE